MDNGKQPANPIALSSRHDADGTITISQHEEYYEGLSKREHFAGLAPDNIPPWFHEIFSNVADPKLTWHRESTDFQIGECGWTQEGERALYFAWRAYYADELLKELDK